MRSTLRCHDNSRACEWLLLFLSFLGVNTAEKEPSKVSREWGGQSASAKGQAGFIAPEMFLSKEFFDAQSSQLTAGAALNITKVDMYSFGLLMSMACFGLPANCVLVLALDANNLQVSPQTHNFSNIFIS